MEKEEEVDLMKQATKTVILGLALLQLVSLGGGAAQAAPTRSAREKQADTAYRQMLGSQKLGIERTDPELAAMLKKYIYADITEQAKLPRREQHLATLAVLTTLQNGTLLEKNVSGALQDGVTPLEVRETIYHLAPYIGFARVLDAITVADRVFQSKGIALPLPAQGTVTDADRFDRGLAFQVGTYGERITKMREATPAEQKHLQDDLSAFCFGDIYTRGTLDLKTRELITVAALGTLGTAEPQFMSHVRGYLAAGASQQEVIGAITVMNPYMGFPRTLNCLRMVNEIFNKK